MNTTSTDDQTSAEVTYDNTTSGLTATDPCDHRRAKVYPGYLEQITEGSNTGYRINGSNNGANYGDIGVDAVDLSYSSGTSSTRGATRYSFSAGYNNIASGILHLQ